MGRIIRLPGDPHQQTQSLLPWYINGTLDEGEVATVEAHLADCADCRGDLAAERTIGADLSAIPIDVDRGWQAMRARLDGKASVATPEPVTPPPPAPSARVVSLTPRRAFFRRSVPVGWALGAQAAALVLIAGGAMLALPAQRAEPLYHALGTAPSSTPGNVVVVFRPDTTERDLRAALIGSSARLVDGPTASDAYVLRVADAGRDAALARLRTNGHVVLAEPIDGTGSP